DRRIGQQGHSRATRIRIAEQEIAVAVHEENRDAGSVQCGQRVGDARRNRVRRVVSDPRLEQVAEDVQRTCMARLAMQEVDEPFDDVRPTCIQVQDGDEQRAHASDRLMPWLRSCRRTEPHPALRYLLPMGEGKSDRAGRASAPIHIRFAWRNERDRHCTRSTLSITTAVTGTSLWNGPCAPVGVARILSTTSSPEMTLPNAQ